jgi:5-methylcytosine-specific restriction protein A
MAYRQQQLSSNENMTARKSLSRLARVRCFDAHKGKCHLCGLKINPLFEDWDVEHIKPLWLGGEDIDANRAPAHLRCHKAKSAGEKTEKAKGDRIRANFLGVPKASHRPIPGSKASGLKRKMDGSVVRR